MAETRPELTLVISTRNRADRLRATLERLDGITTDRRWDLVLVDNGSTDSTPEVLRRFEASTAINVRRVVEPEKGISRARNAGLRVARGEVIAFTDDDCYPERDYVDAMLAVFADRDDVGYVAGRVLLHDPSDARITVREETDPETFPPHAMPRTGHVHGANMAFRRKVLREVGPFDECLGVGTPSGSGEDIEMCGRAAGRGWAGAYHPAPTVRHHHGRKPGPEIERLRLRYDQGRGAYYASTILGCRRLRKECLKRWYWRARSGPRRRTLREVAGAMRYLACRAVKGRTRRWEREPG